MSLRTSDKNFVGIHRQKGSSVSSTLAVRRLGQRDFTLIAATALRNLTSGSRSAAKVLADAANANVKTAENWLAAKTTPTLYHWACLEEAFPELKAEIRRARGLEADGESPEELISNLINQAVRLRAHHEANVRADCGVVSASSRKASTEANQQSGAMDAQSTSAAKNEATN